MKAVYSKIFNKQPILSGLFFKQFGNSFGENAILGTNDNFSLIFETNDTQRGAVDTSGNWGFGLTSSIGARVHIKGAGNTSSTYGFLYENSTGEAGKKVILKDNGEFYFGADTYGTLNTLTIVRPLGKRSAQFFDNNGNTLYSFSDDNNGNAQMRFGKASGSSTLFYLNGGGVSYYDNYQRGTTNVQPLVIGGTGYSGTNSTLVVKEASGGGGRMIRGENQAGSHVLFQLQDDPSNNGSGLFQLFETSTVKIQIAAKADCIFNPNGGKCAFGHSSTATDMVHIKTTNGYDQFRLETTYTPSAVGDTNGQVGSICWDDTSIYVKTSAGWKNTELSAI